LSQLKDETTIEAAFNRQVKVFDGSGLREIGQFDAALNAPFVTAGELPIHQ
jgi:hypothetical protein